MRIGINCGHTVSGQPGCGAVGRIDESVETRAVGKILIDMLKSQGHTVHDCTNDYAPSTTSNLRQIIDMANAHPLDLFVSIHFNSGGGRGTEVFTYGGKIFPEAENTCKAIHELGFKNRGIKDGSNLYVVRRSDAKAMLVECCFVDTDDADEYKSIGAKKMASAICKGITGQAGNEDDDMKNYDEIINKMGEEIASLKEEVEILKNPMIYNFVDENMPGWAKEAVQWCMDKGIISGTGNGLNLTDAKLWTCVVIHRTVKLIAKIINVKI